MPEILEKTVNTTTSDVTVTTTSETVAITSDPVPICRPTALVAITGWLQLTTGTSTTAVSVAIRRGSTVSGTLVGEQNAENIKCTAGQTEPFSIMVLDSLANADRQVYSLTVKQTGAAANGSVLQAGIAVEVLGG